MSATPPAEPVEACLEQLRERLWPGLVDTGVDGVLDEIRDHLLCEVAERVAAHEDDVTAARRAVHGLGPVDRLAAGLRTELVRPHLRRLSATLLCFGAAAAAVWNAALLAGPAEPWPEPGQPMQVSLLDEGGEWTGVATVLAALVGLVLMAGAGRWGRPGFREKGQRWAAGACVASAVLGVATAGQLAAYLAVRAHAEPHSLSVPAVAAAALFTALGALFLLPGLRTVTIMIGGRTGYRPRRCGWPGGVREC